MNDTPVMKATGKELHEWFEILDDHDARGLPHKDIAGLLTTEYGVPGWWSQNVTVEYEKHIGRRETGQTQGGDYEATVTRTLPGSMDDVLERWEAHLAAAPGEAVFDGVAWAREPAVSRTEKWRYWRVPLVDGSRVTVTISGKAGGSAKASGPAAILAVTSSRLPTREASVRWKAFWRSYLAGL